MDFVICKPKLDNVLKIDNIFTSLIQYIENENMFSLLAKENEIARSLMKEFIDWVSEKKVAYVELSACIDNKNAINLYENDCLCIDKICLRKEI